MDDKTFEDGQHQQQQTFQRTVWFQIYLPLLAGVLVLGGLVTWIWIAGAGTGSAWADSAITLLSIPALILGVLVLGVLGGLVYLVFRVLQELPAPLAQVQEFFVQVSHITRGYADKLVKPVIATKAFWASLMRAGEILGSIFSKESSVD